MSDRTWQHLENHRQSEEADRAEVEARIRDLAAKYDVPWEDVERSVGL